LGIASTGGESPESDWAERLFKPSIRGFRFIFSLAPPHGGLVVPPATGSGRSKAGIDTRQSVRKYPEL